MRWAIQRSPILRKNERKRKKFAEFETDTIEYY